MTNHFIHTRPVTAPGVAQYICPVELRQGWREEGGAFPRALRSGPSMQLPCRGRTARTPYRDRHTRSRNTKWVLEY